MYDVRQYPNASKLDHHWVSGDWLDSIGLSQYSDVFEQQLVDARLLNVLSKKDLDKHLNIHNKFHQSSILHAVQLLRIVCFDIQVTVFYIYMFIRPSGTISSGRASVLPQMFFFL